MKVVFVHLGREHLGIEYLSAVLKREGYQVELVHDAGLFSLEDNVFYFPFWEKFFRQKDMAKQVISKKPDLIAFSAYTPTYKWASILAAEIKQAYSVPIVFGGIHPTLLPEKVISQPFVDYVIRGEGEESLLSLLNSLEGFTGLEKVNNLYYKRDGKIIKNSLKPAIKDLDNLPFPDKSLFEGSVRYKDDYTILTSRGCLFSCSYCCESFLNGLYQNKYFRRRSVDSVIEELTVMKKKYNFKRVMFFDSILFTDKKWLKNLLLNYKRAINVPFRCTGHVGVFDSEIGKLMKDSGCYSIEFGVQTFNDSIRREILNRWESNAQIRKAFDACDNIGLHYDVDLMFGLPGTSLKDYETALVFLKNNRFINRIKCYYLSYYPRLAIIDKAKSLDILSEEDIQTIETGEIGGWFHLDRSRDKADETYKQNFRKLYKIYPGLPYFLRSFFIKKKLYKVFRFIPNIFIILMQVLIGLMKRDYRFHIYVNNYFYHLNKKIFSDEK